MTNPIDAKRKAVQTRFQQGDIDGALELQTALLAEARAAGRATARDALFAPLGMASAVLEPDSSGTFIASSFMYATARDWAKLGLLYLNDGVTDGTRLLPEGWSAYVAAPAKASDGFYGAQFWLNHPGTDGRPKYMPGVPDDEIGRASCRERV